MISIKPLVSEKSSVALSRQFKYTYFVNLNANKIDISKYISKKYGVKVKAVNTLLLKGKVKRKGKHIVTLPDRKKAIVTLFSGQEIKEFKEIF